MIDSESFELLIAAEDPENELPGQLSPRQRHATSAGVVIVDTARFKTIFEQVVATRQLATVDLHRQIIPWALDHEISVKIFDICQPAHDLGTPERLLAFGRNE